MIRQLQKLLPSLDVLVLIGKLYHPSATEGQKLVAALSPRAGRVRQVAQRCGYAAAAAKSDVRAGSVRASSDFTTALAPIAK